MSGKLRLLEVSRGSGEDALEIKHLDLDHPGVPYVACAVFTDTVDCTSETSTPNLKASVNHVTLPTELQQMIQQLRDPAASIYVWIDQLCTKNNLSEEQMESQYHPPSLKDTYTAAKETIIWAGADHDISDEGCFDAYLGTGNCQTTEHAFSFATRLAESDLSDISRLFDERYSIDGSIHSWAYLFRILCRPFFRGLPLLRTNYVSGLPRATVLCGRTRISLNALRQAAHRIWAVFPITHFLQNLKLSTENKEDRMIILDIDRAFLLSCLRFGLDPFTMFARLREIFVSAEDEPDPRFLAHMGFCSDIYYNVSNDLSKMIVRQAAGLTQEFVSNPTTFIEKAITYHQDKEVPSLSFEGHTSCPPRAEDQAPFVHWRIFSQDEVRLLRLLPASRVDEPLQCGIVDIPFDEKPEFKFVINNTFIRKKLDTINFHGVQFPTTTRSTAVILVNGQAFVIPKLQEVFLRLIRDSSESVQLFLWNICFPLQSSVLETRDDVERYIRVKRYLRIRGESDEVDMYEVLDNALKERGRDELEALGLPDTRSWDQWLLELND